jgi:hypothetical protein
MALFVGLLQHNAIRARNVDGDIERLLDKQRVLCGDALV